MTDIIVNGKRINWGGGDVSSSGVQTFYQQESGPEPHPTLYPTPEGGGGAEIPSEPTDTDPPKVAAKVNDPANLEKVREAADKTQKQIDRLTPKIMGISDHEVIRLKDGRQITGAQLKAVWLKTDFVITDENFGPDRGGQTLAAVSVMNMNVALGYAAIQSTVGLSYILLHEIAHSTPEIRDFNRTMNNYHNANHQGRPLDGSDSCFRDVEAFANAFTLNVMSLLPGEGLVTNTNSTDPSKWMPPFGT